MNDTKIDFDNGLHPTPQDWAIVNRISEQQRLTITKVIYAKVKGTYDKALANKVFINEIQQHLRQNPDLVFVEVGEPTKNPDLSRSFPIHFAYRKPAEPAPSSTDQPIN